MSNEKKVRGKKTSIAKEAKMSEAQHVEAQPIVSEAPEEHIEAPEEHIETPEEHIEAPEEPLDAQPVETSASKLPKKRGRKPKGGKIIQNNFSTETNKSHEPNIIMHLKCGGNDLIQNTFSASTTYEPSVETFQFENSKTNDLGYSVIDYGVKEYSSTKEYNENQTLEPSEKKGNENDEMRQLWGKLKELTYQLHTNSISDKKSACFWCTCDFDNPTILIPKFELNKMYHCYGCFCSPECATAYLFEEPIDTSTRFERYHLLNHIYCKIYNYEKNIKPAPNPYYVLNKYYGNLSIQEYRKLLKNERLLLVVDKPLSRILPELHEDNDDYMFNGTTISTSNKFKLRRKTKQTKTDILTDTFNLGGKPLGGNPPHPLGGTPPTPPT
jgi:hypothetical protein